MVRRGRVIEHSGMCSVGRLIRRIGEILMQKRLRQLAARPNAPCASGDEEWQRWRSNTPDVVFFGRKAADEYARMIYTIVGPDCCYTTEEEFCKTSSCPREALEDWLSRDWVRHSIQHVERMQEHAGVHPLILLKENGQFCTLRLFSPNPERINCPPPTTLPIM
jgi:hypothetical protein